MESVKIFSVLITFGLFLVGHSLKFIIINVFNFDLLALIASGKNLKLSLSLFHL